MADVGVFIVVVVGVQTWELRTAHERTRLSQESRLRQQAQLLGARLELHLVAIDAGLRSVAADLPGWSARGDSTEVHARLKALDAAIVGVRTLAVVSESGLVLAASRDGLSGLNVSALPYFSKARNDNNATRVYLSAPYRTRLGVWSLNVVRVLQHSDGRFAGAVVATLDPEWLAVTVGSINYAADMWSGLTHTEGGLLFLAPRPNAAIEGANLARPGTMFSRHMASGETETLLEGSIAITGQGQRVIVQRTLRPAGLQLDGNLVIGTSRSVEGMYADWQEHLVAALWLTALLAALTAIGLALIQRSERRRASMTEDLDRLAKVAQRTSNAVVITDSNRRIVWVNDGFTRICGYTLDEVRGRVPGHVLQSEKTDAATLATIRQRLNSGSGFRAELCNRAKDGRDYWVDIDVQPLIDAGGRVSGFMAVETDITEARSTRLHLERLAREQAVMLDSDLIGMVRLKDRRTVWKNQAMDRIFGYSGAEWEDLPSRALYFDDETHQRTGAELSATLQQGRTYRVQLQMRHKDGRAIWIDASGALLPATAGEVMMMLADITPLKAAEEMRLKSAALEAQNFQLRETNRLKSELVSNMSHELRTPLNAILGFGQMLEAGTVKSDSPKFANYISRIVGSGKHLLGLIDQVLDYAKAESGRLSFDIESVSVVNAVEEVIEMVRTESTSRRIDIQVHVDEGLNFVVADLMRLRQMLFALISNAVKFSKQDGRVDITAETIDEARWRLSVADRGIGIEDADIKRLFMPFVQLSSGATKTHGGTGIGLALVRLIARAQGGEVQVASRLDQGSTFTLTLPRDLDPTPSILSPR